jgi:hypothetical protein
MDQEPERVVETNPNQAKLETRKPYSKPQIIYEFELETRAGSPLPFVDPLDINNGDY